MLGVPKVTGDRTRRLPAPVWNTYQFDESRTAWRRSNARSLRATVFDVHGKSFSITRWCCDWPGCGNTTVDSMGTSKGRIDPRQNYWVDRQSDQFDERKRWHSRGRLPNPSYRLQGKRSWTFCSSYIRDRAFCRFRWPTDCTIREYFGHSWRIAKPACKFSNARCQ